MQFKSERNSVRDLRCEDREFSSSSVGREIDSIQSFV